MEKVNIAWWFVTIIFLLLVGGFFFLLAKLDDREIEKLERRKVD